MTNIIALTTVNAVLLAGWFLSLRYRNIPWRIVLAMLPTPMLGFASSYGVYAFNSYFVPGWVAIAMAAAYELTYVGLASYTALNTKQKTIGLLISRDAAWISFAQNGLVGLAHIQPSVMGYSNWGALALIVNVPLAALHAAQVWIAYRTANFTLHGVESSENVVNVDKMDILPAPQVDNTMPKVASKVDKRAADWLELYEGGMTYEAISESLGGKPSRQYIYKHVALYRESLVSEVA